MTITLRDIRLIPIVLLAIGSLFALKVSGLVFDGGYTLGERLQGRDKTDMKVTDAESIPEFPKIVFADRAAPQAAAAPKSWAQEMFNFNGDRDVTGSVPSAGADDKNAADKLKVSDKPPAPPKLEVAGASIPLEQGRINSPGERAILERLQDRRQELEARSRELEMRENLIKAAEQRLEAKVSELKEMESRANSAAGARDKAEMARFKGIVQMYENMKPKEAARIFDRLDMKILVEVSTQMNARRMSDILAQMSPEAAEKLTVELAGKAGTQAKVTGADQLPKIEGKPTN